jgi:predicted ATPase/class 3 adenylate cyclase
MTPGGEARRTILTTMPATTGRTATYLLTDIEGSTRLWDADREAMAVALAAHDGLLRSSVEAAGGSVLKGTGDGLLATFDRPEWAVAAALEGQRALDEHDWSTVGPIRVRMAIHSGGVEVRDGDIFGPPLNRVARLLAIGHGGQVLVSGVTATMVEAGLPPTVSLIDLGEHRLRDLAHAEHVFQLVAPGLARDFPALRSVAERATNLPIQLTSFVGREKELVDVRRLLGSGRLVTLVGVGGTGKTRLMLEAAAEDAERHADGVWLVELAPVRDPALVVQEVASALGVREQPGLPPIGVVIDYLRAKDLLLLLDNCEHLITAAADHAQALLASCPHLTILATSREPLGVAGEAIYPVPSLALPEPIDRREVDDGRHATQLAEAAASEAVRLFVDRATATVPSFVLDPGAIAAVVDICQRLDGIPLAIELAAARVNVLSVEEIAQGLGDRFRLLTGGRRTAVPRQQTLQALIDWSWDLLDESDQRQLRRLSVFAGQWTLEAATEVTVDAQVVDEATDRETPAAGARLETLDGLSRLADRSMIVVERAETTRYRMLETVRQYARDRLVAAGEASALRTRHLEHYALLAREAAAALRGPDEVMWLHRLDPEVDNLRAALDWAFESDPEAALTMSVAMLEYWRSRSVGSEALDRVEQAVALARSLPEPSPETRPKRGLLVARTLAAAALASATLGDPGAARNWSDRAVTLARSSGDPVALLDALSARSLAMIFSGDDQDPVQAGEEVIALGERLGDWSSVAFAASGLAMHHAPTDTTASVRWLDRATEAARQSGNPSAIAFTGLARGRIHGFGQQIDEARRSFLEAWTRFGEIDDRRFQLVARSDLAHALRRAGNEAEAEAEYRATIHAWEHLGNRGAVANQLENVGFLARARGDGARAARLLGAADALREEAGAAMLSIERAEYDAELAQLRAALEPTAFAQAWAEGRSLTMDEAVALVLS